MYVTIYRRDRAKEKALAEQAEALKAQEMEEKKEAPKKGRPKRRKVRQWFVANADTQIRMVM